jgi:hypothetical protein
MSGLQKPAGIEFNGSEGFSVKRLVQFSISYQLAVMGLRLLQQMSAMI